MGKTIMDRINDPDYEWYADQDTLFSKGMSGWRKKSWIRRTIQKLKSTPKGDSK